MLTAGENITGLLLSNMVTLVKMDEREMKHEISWDKRNIRRFILQDEYLIIEKIDGQEFQTPIEVDLRRKVFVLNNWLK